MSTASTGGRHKQGGAALLAVWMVWFAPGDAGAAGAAGSEAPRAQLDRPTVAARGRQAALLTVNAFGRYAITASSGQGVALQLVDRMAGAGPVAGEAGRQDGRLDVFLDRGEHKVVTLAAERGSGQANLAAHAFRELHATAPLLVEHRLERASLGDFEQRSYWLEIKERRTVALEAGGRHLADLRLWRDGTWLVEATPQLLPGQGRPEQPLAVARLTAELDPGLYLLTAYGGPAQPWTEASEAKPFLLRYGIPPLPREMRQQFTMSEFGIDRYVVPSGPSHFRLELPVAHAATLRVASHDPRNPFADGGAQASIDKRALPPVAELRQSDDEERIVTVATEPGKPFILQHFEASWSYRFGGSGEYWVSSIHAGHADDSVGASAVLTRQTSNRPEELLAEQAIDLDDPWRRRFNLLDRLTLIVKVPHATAIRVVGEGVRARYRLEPFLTSRPRDYKTPGWEASGHLFPVLSGLYVLTVEPETKGILDLQLLPGLSLKGQALTPVTAGVRFPAVRLESNTAYTLYLNQQPGVAAGVVVRPLPIDLRFALPVAPKPGETLTIPVSVPERGTLRARSEDGRALELTLDNGKTGPAHLVEPGRYKVTIRTGDTAKPYSLALEPARLASTTPLPALPDTRLAGLPKFPVIAAGAPQFLDLGRERSATYSVRVDQPGLYRFETTGLLHTGGKVRTRINPALFAETRNGVGGNFMIQRYLREGEYQLTVATEGETQGHLGVQLARTEVTDGGELREGEVARAQLPIGHALAYRFTLTQRGTYRLQAIGLGRSFEVRLEDNQGWPVLAPLQGGDLTAELEAGSYRLVVMPQTAEARVLTRLDRIEPPKRYAGHGPHRIALNTPVSHTWVEPAKGKPRRPDTWEFTLPAAAEVTISLDNEMTATLVAAAAPKASLASVDARQIWRGLLPAGRYRLQATNARTNNYVPYTLQVAATPLLAGQSRTVTAPATVPVAVGSDGLVEIESFGRGDVRARLLDAAGETVAQNDDRPGDWNFQLAQRLRPGDYRLVVDPVNQKRSTTTVSMHAPGEAVEPPLPLAKDVEIKDAKVHVYPLTLPAAGNVLLVSARSGDAVGLALEAETAQGWRTLGTQIGKDPHLVLPLALPVAERHRAYRLRAWSAERRSLKLKLRAVAAMLPMAAEAQWLQGAVAPQRVDAQRPELKVALVVLARPGAFRLAGDLSHLQWTDSPDRAAQESRDAVLAVSGRMLWLVSSHDVDSADSAGSAGTLSAERLRLPVDDQEPLRLELMPGQVASVDLPPNPAGPALVLAQSRAGQPGAAIGEARDAAAIGFVPGEVATVALAGSSAPARVWNADGAGAPLELDVRQVALRQGETHPLRFGVGEGTIKARTALTLTLPGGGQRVRLTLAPQVAAVFLKQDRPRSTHWAGSEALQEILTTDADRLWLLNAGADEAPYSLDLAPAATNAAATEDTLKPGELIERNLATAGRLRLAVDVPPRDGAAYRLSVRGAVQALWQEAGGRVAIAHGNDLVIGGSGVLWLQHRPGTAVAWLEEVGVAGVPGSERLDRWRAAYRETRVKPPESVPLSGKQQLLGFQLEQPAMLQLRTSAPVVSQFLVPGQPARTAAHLFGASVNLPAPAGSALLMLRAVGAESLAGVASVTASAPIGLTEGVGPEVLLAPGGARLFGFELAQAATVGIGVRASADVVRAVLYDQAGAALSEGVVQMPALAPGRYYLAVELPPDSPPVRVRPIVLGLAKPDTRPPYEILQRYVESPRGGEGPEAAEALLYVPPPPAPPPATVPEAGEGDEGDEGDGPAPEDEAATEDAGQEEDAGEGEGSDMPGEDISEGEAQ